MLKLISTPESTSQTAMRLLIPRQQPLTQLFADLAQLTRTLATSNGSLPAPVSAAIQKLMDALPRAQELRTPEKIARAILDSGSFLESKLAMGSATNHTTRDSNTTQADLKALLLRLFVQLRATATLPDNSQTSARSGVVPPLAQSMSETIGNPDRNSASRQLPPLPTLPLQPQSKMLSFLGSEISMQRALLHLAEQIDAVLSRIQVTQLSHANHDPNTPTSVWTVELPIRYGEDVDIVQIRWQQDNENDAATGKRAWIISLSFDFPETGPVLVYSKLIGSSVSTTFHTERADTTESIRRELPYLESLLLHSGLTVGQLGCVNQCPAQNLSIPLGLIDTRI